jgi:hypothetical protein
LSKFSELALILSEEVFSILPNPVVELGVEGLKTLIHATTAAIIAVSIMTYSKTLWPFLFILSPPIA